MVMKSSLTVLPNKAPRLFVFKVIDKT